MKFLVSYGMDGRTVEGEKNDCTVRALSLAFNVPYGIVHEYMSSGGRKFGRGINFWNFMVHHRKHQSGLTVPQGTIFDKPFIYYARPGMTVENFLLQYNKGTYIVHVPKHVFAVEKGFILDSFLGRPGQRIKDYYCIVAEPDRPTPSGPKIQQIIKHFKAGKSKKEIVALGYHYTTVNIQINKYVKSLAISRKILKEFFGS